MLRLFLFISGILFANGSSFEERLKILEIIVDKQQVEMDLLKKENIAIKEANTALTSRVKELELLILSLKDKATLEEFMHESDLHTEMHENGNHLNVSNNWKTKDGHKTPSHLSNQNRESTARVSRRALMQSGRVAFHVYLSSNKCFNDHQIIEYDTEVLDTGNGYNQHDGIYIVPESGIYVFSWTFLADYAEYAVTEIVINGVTKGWTLSDGTGHWLLLNPSFALIIARVNAGDHVFIRRAEGRGCTAYSGHYIQPTFSGWQLSP